MEKLPLTVCWRRIDFNDGLEFVRLGRSSGGYAAAGHVIGIDQDGPWFFRYNVVSDAEWVTTEVRCQSVGPRGNSSLTLDVDADRVWRIDGEEVLELQGCVDVDLAGSIVTNTLPIRRLALEPGGARDVRVAWIDVPDLQAHAAEQRYTRLDDAGGVRRYEFAALDSDTRYELSVDEFGLVIDYEGIAARVGIWRQE